MLAVGALETRWPHLANFRLDVLIVVFILILILIRYCIQ